MAPTELEALILTKPEVADVGVIGIPAKEEGEVPVALVVKKPRTELTENDLMDFVAGKASIYKLLSSTLTEDD